MIVLRRVILDIRFFFYFSYEKLKFRYCVFFIFLKDKVFFFKVIYDFIIIFRINFFGLCLIVYFVLSREDLNLSYKFNS